MIRKPCIPPNMNEGRGTSMGQAADDNIVWHVTPMADLLEELGADKAGLSSEEVRRRLAEHGPNEIRETKGISPLAIFLGQFKSLLVWILIVAGVVAGALGELVDAAAILAIVVLNGIIGFHQEFKAEKSIAALRKLAQDNLVNLTPHPFYVFMHHSHPPMRERIASLSRQTAESSTGAPYQQLAAEPMDKATGLQHTQGCQDARDGEPACGD